MNKIRKQLEKIAEESNGQMKIVDVPEDRIPTYESLVRLDTEIASQVGKRNIRYKSIIRNDITDKNVALRISELKQDFYTKKHSDEYEQQLTKQIEKVSAIKMQLETTKRKLETNQEVDPTVNSLELAEQYLKHSQHYDDCLREQNDRELAMAEKSVKESYKETLIRTIEQFLPMSYEEFKKLDLDEQQIIIDSIKEQQGNIQKDLFQQRFDSYISDLEEDSDLHLGLIEEDEEDMKDYNKPKVLKRRNIKKILDDDIED